MLNREAMPGLSLSAGHKRDGSREPVVMPSTAVYCTNAFLLSVVMMLWMSKLAPRLGLVDIPTGRKLHEGQIPLVGAGVFLAILGTAAFLPSSGEFVALFVSMGFIVAL